MLRHIFRRCVHQQPRTVLSKDEKHFLAYHPEESHPYEMTRPIPKDAVNEAESILRVDSRKMFVQSPNLEQLQNLTYTHRRYWRAFIGKEKRMRYQDWFNDKKTRSGLTT